MKCPYCGSNVNNEKFCPNCGGKLVGVQQPKVQGNNPMQQQMNNPQQDVRLQGGYSPQQKPKKPIYKKWWFWVIIAVIVISIGAGSADGGKSSKDTGTKETTTVSTSAVEKTTAEKTTEETTTVQPTTKAKKKVSAKAYKNSCKTLSFKDLSRNPDKHKGEKLKYTGLVIQVQEDEHWLDDNTTVDLRINVTKDEYGLWDDTIYATVELPKNADRILEKDIITIWGECDGKYSYTSVLGSDVTLPKINIEYYSVKSK